MSFAQEIKDFIGSAQSTYKMLDDAEYNKMKRAYMKAQMDELTSPERKAKQKADLEHTQAGTAKLNQDLNDPSIRAAREASTAYTRANTNKVTQDTNDPLRDDTTKATNELRRSQAEYYRSRANPPAIPSEPIADSIPAPVRAIKPAIPTSPAPDAPAPGPMSENLLDEPQEGMEPSQFAARGGMVQKLAIGGPVVDGAADEDDDPNDEDDVAQPAIGPTDVSAQSRTPQISKDAGHDAVTSGLKYGASQIGDPTGVPTAQRQQRLQAYARGAGAAPIADMNAIYKKIDPNNEMGESERNLNALSAVYQYKMRAGDAVGAQRSAFMMLQHYRLASQRYAAIAAAAAEHGDVDGAAKAAMKAYANIPDGKDFKVSKVVDKSGQVQLQYSLTDEQTGKTVTQGIASPQELASAAMGVATKGFDSFLLDAAGQRHTTKGAVGAKPPKEGEKGRALEGINSAYEKAFPSDKSDQPALGPDEERTIKGSAYRIYTANPSLTHDEAIDITKRLISPNAKKPDETGFAAKKLEDGQGYQVKVGKGPSIHLSDEEFDNFASLRAEKTELLKKAKEGEGKKGFISEAASATGDYLSKVPGAIGDWVKDDMAKAEKQYPEAVGRAKSAVGAVGRAIGDAYDWAKEDLKKPSIWDGIANGPGKDKL